ncbi:MAG: cupin domain-containing protein [Alphaproteobacteria bacterium]
MMPEKRVWTRDEMMKRVAFFKDLNGSKTGLPDSHLPQSEKELMNVIGFRPPEEDNRAFSPVGEDQAQASAIDIFEGFNLGFVKCKPGKGPLNHNHDTNETFMPITGKWRCHWNEGDDYEYVDVGPCDVVSFPPGVVRRFSCLEAPEGEEEALMQFVIGGEFPEAEFTEASLRTIEEFGPAPE